MRALLLWLLLLAAPCAASAGTTVDVYTEAQLAAAVANAAVSTVVLQRSLALSAGLALAGRQLTLVGNTSGCFDASISPPPPPPPQPPPPAPPPPVSVALAVSVTFAGYTAATLDTAKFEAGVAASMPANTTVRVTAVADVALRRRLLAAGVAVNFTVTTLAPAAAQAALGSPAALGVLASNLAGAGLTGVASLAVASLAIAPTPAPGAPGPGSQGGGPGQPGPAPAGGAPQGGGGPAASPPPPPPPPSPAPSGGVPGPPAGPAPGPIGPGPPGGGPPLDPPPGRRRRLLAAPPLAAASTTGAASASAPLDGRCTLLLSPAAQARHFTLRGANLTLQAVSLTGGYFNDTTAGAAPAQTYVHTLAANLAGDALGGGAIYADASSWVAGSDCSLSYNTGYPRGGAVCSLNPASDAVVLQRCALSGNALLPAAVGVTVVDSLGGGAVFAKGGVALADCTLNSNYVPKVGGVTSTGGAVYAPAVTLQRCTLQSNAVRGPGGALALAGCAAYSSLECAAAISDSDMSYNEADSGGAISSDVGDLTSVTRVVATNTVFASNSAGEYGGNYNAGGAISVVAAALTLSGCSFDGNVVVGGHGGAIYSGPLLVATAAQGGRIPVLPVAVTNCSFTGNSAPDGSGGSLFAEPAYKYLKGNTPSAWSLVSLTDAQLSGNAAGVSGGAVYVANADVALTRVACVGNSAAAGAGGCAAVSLGTYNALEGLGGFALADSVVSGNSAVSGGALALGCSRQTADPTLQSYYLSGGSACNGTLSVSGSALSGNAASAQGGAVWHLAGGSLVLSGGTVLANNSAAGASASGGALFVADYLNPFSAPALALDGAALVGNSVSLETTALLPGESATATFGAGLGGAVCVTATATAAAAVRVSGGAALRGNSAVSGGALFAYGSLTVTASDSTFSANVAEDRGGALLLQSGTAAGAQAVAAFTNVSATGNTAARGGAVALNAGSALSAAGGAFTGNAASLGGGAFFMQVGALATPVISLTAGCNASGNSAYAGGLAYTDSITAIDPPTFDSTCAVGGNAVTSFGALIASPPVEFNVSAPAQISSGSAIAVVVALYDAFGQKPLVWPGVIATVSASDAGALSGPALTSYAAGAASFPATTLRGPVGTTYLLRVSVSSAALLERVTSAVGSVNLTVAPCAANEVFQASSQLCVCAAGYAPSASGDCGACAAGTYAPAAGSASCSVCASGAVSAAAAVACTACPPNSLVVANACACGVGFYDAEFGAAAAPECTACPLGAACTTGTLGAQEGWWRETLNDTVFLPCREGVCLQEVVTGPLSSLSSTNTSNATVRRRRLSAAADEAWPATNCVDGATGPLCGLCVAGYTLQSGVCAACDPGDAWAAWGAGSKAGVLVGCIVFAVLFLAVALFQPIAPAVERGVAAAAAGAQAAKARLLACASCACCRKKEKTEGKGKIPPSPCCSEDDYTVAKPPAAKPPVAATHHVADAAHHAAVVAHHAAVAHQHAAHAAFGMGMMMAMTHSPAAQSHDAASEHHVSAHDVAMTNSPAAELHDAASAHDVADAAHQHEAHAAYGMGMMSSAGNAASEHHVSAHEVADAAHQQAEHAAYGMSMMMSSAGDDAEDDDDDDSGSGEGAFVEVALDAMDELEELVEKLQRVSKIVLNFYQVVSTFLKSLDVPWPAIFGSLMARVSVVNLNLVQLPKTACLNPSPNFYSQFNGYTLGLVAAMLSAGALHVFGTKVLARFTLRGMPDAERAERLSNFHSTVLARTLLVLYVVYPGVSVAIFSIFSCTTLNSGRSYLDADLAITCYDAVHWRYIAAGVAWLFVVPVGVPCFFLRLLRRFHVPAMAALMEDNAWLREAAEHAWTQGLTQPGVLVKALDVDSVTDRHLEALYALLVRDASAEQAADIMAGVAPAMEDEEEESADAEKPKRLAAAAVAAVTSAAARVAAAGKACVRPCGAAAPAADPQEARRVLRLQQVLAWCRTSGAISLPVMSWQDVEDAPQGVEVDTGYVSPSPSGRIACRDLPRLQATALKDVGFLFAAYRCGCWYWEAVELLRKLLLTSILALISPGSAGQVVVGFVLSFVMLMANLRIQPFAEASLNSINALAQLNLSAFLFVALLLKVDVDGESRSSFFSFVVGVLSVVPVALPVVIKVWLRLYGNLEARMAVKDASWG